MSYTAFNPDDKHANISLSGGNLIATNASAVHGNVRVKTYVSTGKFYCEFTCSDATFIAIGVTTSDFNIANASVPGMAVVGASYDFVDGYKHNRAYTPFVANWATGDIGITHGGVGRLAVDVDAGKGWYGCNGSWCNSGNPATGANPAFTFTPGLTIAVIAGASDGGNIAANFGSSAWTYTCPSGFAGIDGTLYEVIADGLAPADLVMSNAWEYIYDGALVREILCEKYPMLIEDAFALAERARRGFYYDKIAESFLNVVEAEPGAAFHILLAEGFSLADAPDFGMWEFIAESLNLADTVRAPFFIVIPDTSMLYDTLKTGWGKTVPDTFALADAASTPLCLIIPDVLTLIDTQHNLWDGVHTIEETAVIRDSSVFAQYLKSIADTMDLADLPRLLLTIPISDWLTLNDAVPLIIRAAILESMLLSDTSLWGWDKTIADTFATADAPSALATFNRAIAESLALASAASFLKTCGVSVPDTMALTDVSASAVKLYNIILESLALNALLDLDGELWECFALNTPRFHASMYSGYNFNSFCVFNGRAFGANDAGIFELTGSTDAGNPIHTGVILKGTDFGTPNQKRMRRGYFGVSGSSPVLILETESGQRQVYSIDTKGKTVASHELKSKSWTLSIADFDALDSVKLIPVILSK